MRSSITILVLFVALVGAPEAARAFGPQVSSLSKLSCPKACCRPDNCAKSCCRPANKAQATGEAQVGSSVGKDQGKPGQGGQAGSNQPSGQAGAGKAASGTKVPSGPVRGEVDLSN